MDEVAVAESAPGERLSSYTQDPFERYFEGRSTADVIAANPLLDTPNVHRWFDLFQAGLAESLYTYQLPLNQEFCPN